MVVGSKYLKPPKSQGLRTHVSRGLVAFWDNPKWQITTDFPAQVRNSWGKCTRKDFHKLLRVGSHWQIDSQIVCKLPAFQTIRDYTHVFVGFQDMNPWPLAEYCKHDQQVGLLVPHLWSPSGLVVLLPCCCRVSASGSGNCLLWEASRGDVSSFAAFSVIFCKSHIGLFLTFPPQGRALQIV